MRLHNYINENKSNIDEYLKEIEKNCSKILAVYRKTNPMYIYRTTKENFKFNVFTPRTDRRPLDTPEETQKELDNLFFKKFGWRPRSSAVFGANKPITKAEWYGNNVYVLFPFDGFKFLYSPKIADLFSEVDETRTEPAFAAFGSLEEMVATYTDKGLTKFITGRLPAPREIMFQCSHYYLLNHSYGQTIELMQYLSGGGPFGH